MLVSVGRHQVDRFLKVSGLGPEEPDPGTSADGVCQSDRWCEAEAATDYRNCLGNDTARCRLLPELASGESTLKLPYLEKVRGR
jgi:hypothetical protein